MSDLCRCDHHFSEESCQVDFEDGLDNSLRILARIIARKLSQNDQVAPVEDLTEKTSEALLVQGKEDR